ncbi:hypothetical protein PG994_006170 [Apiospora phragmitis]|uniref:Uncharacterized protein n=1 Tax=Apiospora phragmitis TaxID=2905665 RepID=A0ABR1VEB4_9PEZI
MKPRVRTSRRVPALKDSDIDHEIILVDHSGSAQGDASPRPGASPDADNRASTDVANTSGDERPVTSSESRLPLRDAAAPISDHDGNVASSQANGHPNDSNNNTKNASREDREPQTAEEAGPSRERQSRRRARRHHQGGFLCGIPLFASAALGNLDPRPGPIPTISRVRPTSKLRNHRIRAGTGLDPAAHKERARLSSQRPYLLNPEYFTVEAAAAKHVSLRDGASSLLDSASRTSACGLHEEDAISEKKDVESTDMLMALLGVSRIDREKLDAVQNYLEHAADNWLDLQNHMHEIMSIFVFQASRRLLLTRLMGIHDDAVRKLDEQKRTGKNKVEGHDESTDDQPDPDLEVKVKNLAAAVTHADEEVRRLEYWSDVKGMAEGGESGGAVSGNHGWQGGWEGVDQSGAVGANREQLP